MMANTEDQSEVQPSMSLPLENCEEGREQPSRIQNEEDHPIIYPDLAPVVFLCLHQTSKLRRWCLNVFFKPWLNWISLLVILLSCVIQGSYQPGEEDSLHQEVFEAFVFLYFIVEMLIKMVALGVFGHRVSYLASRWHKLDVLIIIAELLDFFVVVIGVRLEIGHSLKPMRLISRVPSMKQLMSILIDTLPMLGHIFVLLMFVIHIFAVVGVSLWAGELHNRCFLGEDIVSMYNLSLSPYFVGITGERAAFVCSDDSLSGKRHCSDVPPYKEDGKVCTLAAPHQYKPGNWGVAATAGPNDGDCVNWNHFYNVCRPDGLNPNMGSTSFDNIGYAWITVYQVITLEGWTDIMYYVMDTHSVWCFAPFVLMTNVGAFILMNTGAVVIASHFSEAMIKGRKKVHGSVTNFKKHFYKLISWLDGCMNRMCYRSPGTDMEDRENKSKVKFWPHLLKKIGKMVKSNAFTNAIMVTIFLNIITMAVEHHDQPEEMTIALRVCNLIFTVVFAVEMILKLLVFRMKYFADQGNLFDFIIVIISFWEEGSQVDGRLSVVRAFRVLRFVKLLHFMPHLRKQLMVLWRTMKEASTLCWLMLFFIFIFSVMGMHLFGLQLSRLPQNEDFIENRQNFDSLLWSMVTVFQILTTEDWNLVLYNAMASTSPWSALYFVAIIMLGKNVLLNVLVGIVVENFQTQPTDTSEENASLFISSSSSCSTPEDGTVVQNDPNSESSSTLAIMSFHEHDSEEADQNNRSLNLIRQVLIWCKNHEDWSFYILSPKNKFRTMCYRTVSHKLFDIVIAVFIMLSCISIAMERPDINPNSMERLILNVAFYLLSFVGFVEMFIKVIATGLIIGKSSYFRSPWNMLDGSLVIISVIQIWITAVVQKDAQILNILKVFRLLRALRPLRMIKLSPKLKLAVESLTASVKPISNIVLICCVFFFFFGILGIQLFKGKFFHCVGEDVSKIVNKSDCLAANYHWVRKEYNFDNMLQALLSLFVMFSKDGWVNIMYDGLDAVGIDKQPIKNYNIWMMPFFISFVVMSFFLLDMFIGVMVETFHHCQLKEKDEDKELGNQEHESKGQESERKPADKEPTASFTGNSQIRHLLHKLCTSKALDLCVTFIIIINVLIMAFEHYNQPEYITRVIEYSNYAFLTIMIIEILLKLVAFGVVKFITDSWNLLDIAIILLSIVSIVLRSLKMTNAIPFNPSILRVCRILRLAQVLKAKNIRVLLKTIIKTVTQVGNICLLFMFFFFIYAALGVELFGKLVCSPDYPCLGFHRHSNFNNFPMALLTLYKVCTGDNWSGIMKDTMRECQPDDANCQSYVVWFSPIYFSTFVILAQFVLANLVVASIMQALEDSKEESEEQLRREHISPSAEHGSGEDFT